MKARYDRLRIMTARVLIAALKRAEFRAALAAKLDRAPTARVVAVTSCVLTTPSSYILSPLRRVADREMPMRARAEKFRELILYVAKRCEADPKCGATKLNKVLFYSDFRAYEELGAAISGEVYQKLENGPAPKRFVPVVRDLEEEQACVWADRRYHGKNLRKLIALREPDLSVFKPEEIDLVRDVIEDLWELNATEVSDLSHRFVGWQAADLKEEIPYGTVFVDDPRPLSEEEHEWALRAIGEYCEREEAAGRPRTGMAEAPPIRLLPG